MEIVVVLLIVLAMVGITSALVLRFGRGSSNKDPWSKKMIVRINTSACTGDGRCQDDCSEILTSVRTDSDRIVYVPVELKRDFGETKVFDQVGDDGFTVPARVPDRLVKKIETAQRYCAQECLILESSKE